MVLWESYTNVSPAGPALPVVDDGDKGQQQDAGRAEPLHLLLPEEDWPPQGFNQSHVSTNGFCQQGLCTCLQVESRLSAAAKKYFLKSFLRHDIQKLWDNQITKF